MTLNERQLKVIELYSQGEIVTDIEKICILNIRRIGATQFTFLVCEGNNMNGLDTYKKKFI